MLFRRIILTDNSAEEVWSREGTAFDAGLYCDKFDLKKLGQDAGDCFGVDAGGKVEGVDGESSVRVEVEDGEDGKVVETEAVVKADGKECGEFHDFGKFAWAQRFSESTAS